MKLPFELDTRTDCQKSDCQCTLHESGELAVKLLIEIWANCHASEDAGDSLLWIMEKTDSFVKQYSL